VPSIPASQEPEPNRQRGTKQRAASCRRGSRSKLEMGYSRRVLSQYQSSSLSQLHDFRLATLHKVALLIPNLAINCLLRSAFPELRYSLRISKTESLLSLENAFRSPLVEVPCLIESREFSTCVTHRRLDALLLSLEPSLCATPCFGVGLGPWKALQTKGCMFLLHFFLPNLNK